MLFPECVIAFVGGWGVQAIVSNAVPILSVDILTVTKEQLDFTADFAVKFTRNDYAHVRLCRHCFSLTLSLCVLLSVLVVVTV